MKSVCDRADSYLPLRTPVRKEGLPRPLVQKCGLMEGGTSPAWWSCRAASSPGGWLEINWGEQTNKSSLNHIERKSTSSSTISGSAPCFFFNRVLTTGNRYNFIAFNSVSQRSAYWLPFISSMAINPKCSGSSFMPWEPLKKMNSILRRAITTALPTSKCSFYELLSLLKMAMKRGELGFGAFPNTGQKPNVSFFSTSYCLFFICCDFLLNFLETLADI